MKQVSILLHSDKEIDYIGFYCYHIFDNFLYKSIVTASAKRLR